MASFKTEAKIRALAHKGVGASLLQQQLSHEGKTDGMGYVVEHVQTGRGLSSHTYSRKILPNGREVSCLTYTPGPYDGLAGRSTDITEEYWVFVGWEAYSQDEESYVGPPGIALPASAFGWRCTAFDGPIHWSAKFHEADLAEQFAQSLPAVPEDWSPAPLIRT